MSKHINIIFPHQLFAESELLKNDHEIYLIEEHLFFQEFNFHKQKIAFHRASMKSYEQYLIEKGKTVHYIETQNERADIRNFQKEIEEKTISNIEVIDPTDDWLEQRIRAVSKEIELTIHENPQFLNKRENLAPFFRSDKKSFFQTSFYKNQRQERGILMEGSEPVGGKWTYDTENRKKFPKNATPPPVQYPAKSSFWEEAVEYTETHFEENLGEISSSPLYPINFKESEAWLEQFLTYRFFDFGIYEDAIVKEYSVLNHSVLSPLINIGLLLPETVLDRSLEFAQQEEIPINSVEGFVRQIMGWREFIRGMYNCKGRYSRTKNFWEFDRKIPPSFYDGTTGIAPIDDTIKKVLKTGYCHHIERLMILGNFMLLCEFDPDEVYRWFMELFIDAYDWVMVPNIYGMSQFADGGTFATKPYIGGSNYIKKMSNYANGEWCETWDGLFWNFIDKHQDFFLSNPRMSMMVRTFEKMSPEKKETHLNNAAQFLSNM
ncbi:MAG: cryptochrome/photolyase family protein [Flavobacteriales bacterium]|nr:cryptochrome/photolyase family protein [Flavobacteriales bacterium]